MWDAVGCYRRRSAFLLGGVALGPVCTTLKPLCRRTVSPHFHLVRDPVVRLARLVTCSELACSVTPLVDSDGAMLRYGERGDTDAHAHDARPLPHLHDPVNYSYRVVGPLQPVELQLFRLIELADCTVATSSL